MNSDKFDRIVLDLLYNELDELTTLAAHRHMSQSSRAREIFAQFQATRKMTKLPAHAPPVGFTEELLRREKEEHQRLPIPKRTGRLVSVLANYAMRPQIVMGTVLLLMICSSLVLLRVRPGQHGPVQITERGAPELDEPRIVAVKSAPPTTNSPSHGLLRRRLPGSLGSSEGEERKANASTKAPSKRVRPATRRSLARTNNRLRPQRHLPAGGLSPFDQAVEVYRAGRYVEAQQRFARLTKGDQLVAGPAALYAARSVRMASGCAPAIGAFERVRLRFPGSQSAYGAAWRAADCLLQAGQFNAARANYESLLRVPEYSVRATAALKRLNRSLVRHRKKASQF